MIAITKDHLGIADYLCLLLIKNGCTAQVVTTPPENTRVLILLDLLNNFNKPDLISKIYLKLFDHFKKIAPSFSQTGGALITVQDTGGYFGCQTSEAMTQTQALLGGLTGLVKTAAQEWPNARCKAIDIACKNQTPADIAQKLYDEIIHYPFDKSELEVGLLDNHHRVLLTLESETISKNLETFFNPGLKKPVLIVTGGAKGITSACIKKLAEKNTFCFALLGTTQIIPEPDYTQHLIHPHEIQQALIQHAVQHHVSLSPQEIKQQLKSIISNREILQNIAALKKSGSQAVYFCVNIKDARNLNNTIIKIRQHFGQINGIIHGAGILADKFITEKTPEQFKTVFETKTTGLQNLLSSTQNDRLSYLILFSSVAGRFGNIGQCDYACANEVLNKIAQYEKQQRGKDCLVKSINWAPWESGMVTPELKKLFLARNIAVIPVETGAEFFVEEFYHYNPADQAEIIYGGSLNKNNIFTKKFKINYLSDSYLNSHKIHHQWVLPACTVLDWFIQASESCENKNKNNNIITIKNFKILKGIQLKDFSRQDYFFTVQREKISPENFILKLLPDNILDNNIYYSAEYNNNFKNNFNIKLNSSKPWPYQLSEIYTENLLFHGPDFQGIDKLVDFSDQGGSAYVRGSKLKNKFNQHFKTDILAFDSVLQLLLLWTYQTLGRQSLPVSMGEVIFFQETAPTEKFYCEFESEKIDHYRTKSNAVLYTQYKDKNKKIYAVFKNIQMCTIGEK